MTEPELQQLLLREYPQENARRILSIYGSEVFAYNESLRRIMQHLQPNTILQGGKYRIERFLGQGGFGNK